MSRVAAGGLALAVVAVALFVVAGPYALDAGLDEAEHNVSIDGETFTPTAGDPIVLEESERPAVTYYRNTSVTVYHENGQVATEGTDYEWLRGNGTVDVLAGGNLDEDSEASIDYGYIGLTQYQAGQSNVTTDAQPVMRVIAFGGFAVLVLVGLLVMAGAAR